MVIALISPFELHSSTSSCQSNLNSIPSPTSGSSHSLSNNPSQISPPVSYCNANYNRAGVQDTTKSGQLGPPEYQSTLELRTPTIVNPSTVSGGIGGDNPLIVAGEGSRVPTSLPDRQNWARQRELFPALYEGRTEGTLTQFTPAEVHSGDVSGRSDAMVNGNENENNTTRMVTGVGGTGSESQRNSREYGDHTQRWSGERIEPGISPKVGDENEVPWDSTGIFSLRVGGVSMSLTPAFWAFWLGLLCLVLWFYGAVTPESWAFCLGLLCPVFWFVGGWHFTILGEQPAQIGVWEYYFACWGRRRRMEEQEVQCRVLSEEGQKRLGDPMVSFGYPFIARPAESLAESQIRRLLRVGRLNRFPLDWMHGIKLRELQGRAESPRRIFDPWIQRCRYVFYYGLLPTVLTLLILVYCQRVI